MSYNNANLNPDVKLKQDYQKLLNDQMRQKLNLNDPNQENKEDTLSLIVNGFCQNVLKKLPMEFALEARALLNLTLEKSIA